VKQWLGIRRGERKKEERKKKMKEPKNGLDVVVYSYELGHCCTLCLSLSLFYFSSHAETDKNSFSR